MFLKKECYMSKQNIKNCLQDQLSKSIQALEVIKTIAIIYAKKDTSIYTAALAMSKLHTEGRREVLAFFEELHPELVEHVRKADNCRLAAFRLGLRGSIEQSKEQAFLNEYDPQLLLGINLEMPRDEATETLRDIIDDNVYYRSDIFGERALFRKLGQPYIDNDTAYETIINYLESISATRKKFESIASLKMRVKKMAVRGNARERAIALKVEDVIERVESELLQSNKKF